MSKKAEIKAKYREMYDTWRDLYPEVQCSWRSEEAQRCNAVALELGDVSGSYVQEVVGA